MALLTVSTESALTEAEDSVLTASVFIGLVANLGFCACVLDVTRHSTVTRLCKHSASKDSTVTNSALARKRGIVYVSAEFGGNQSHEIGSCILIWRILT